MNLDKENSSPTSKRHSFSILDACVATGANVSYSYDKTWAEWNVNIKLSCIPFPERKFRYKRIDIEDSGLGTYEYLRSHIVPEIFDMYDKYVHLDLMSAMNFDGDVISVTSPSEVKNK